MVNIDSLQGTKRKNVNERKKLVPPFHELKMGDYCNQSES